MAAAISSHPATQGLEPQLQLVSQGHVQRVEEVCVPVPGAGGIIGLFISHRARINQTLQEYNRQGYTMTSRAAPVGISLAYGIVQAFFLAITLLLWCPKPAEFMFFRRPYLPQR